MLTDLSIRDYAIVQRLDVELRGGMTCVTGETGAGKSILLDALGLCIGDRADARAVRAGADRAGARVRALPRVPRRLGDPHRHRARRRRPGHAHGVFTLSTARTSSSTCPGVSEWKDRENMIIFRPAPTHSLNQIANPNV